MTSIAFDGEYIASDGLVNEGGVIVDDSYEKIQKFEGKYRGENIIALAICGSLEYFQTIKDELNKSEPKFPDSEDYVAWIITDKSFWEIYGEHVYKMTAKVNAIGSGSKFVRSALSLGKSAKEAVKHAAKFDVYTGGKIRVLKVRDKKKKQIKNNKKVVMKPAKREDVEKALNKVVEQYKGAIDNLKPFTQSLCEER